MKSAAQIPIDGATLEKISYAEIPFWKDDNFDLAFSTFQKSCPALKKVDPKNTLQASLHEICEKLPLIRLASSKAFFEGFFTPYKIKEKGFVTAYYEPEFAGSKTRSQLYNTPLYKKPDELVSEIASQEFNSRRKAGVLDNGILKPFFTRGEIENGALERKGLEIVYLKDPNDAFFLSIQGSGRIKLAEGGSVRVGYHAHNGHSYKAIGRVIVERQIAPKEVVTMDYLRDYLKQDESRAKELRAQNPSYVFFRELTELGESDGPIGAQGIPVTDYRTLAVDSARYSYGLPIFVEAMLPIGFEGESEVFNRLMIAQDTGSAIRGVARGDLYLGTGAINGQKAGLVKHEAAWTLLLPTQLVSRQP